VRRLFVKALLHAVLWTVWMFIAFTLLSWTGLAEFESMSVQFWLGMAAVMTVLTMISMPLDERWAKRRDHAKRMKERNFQ